MKRRIAIYGGTELSAGESWFIESLTYTLLSHQDVIIITGGFLYSPEKLPGAISTDFSVLQGATRYAREKGTDLKNCLETWLPDTDVENDPQKKNVVRFKEGNVMELQGESAQARRFSMVRDVDVLITVKGKKHTSIVLDFALTMNKPALPLAFTGGDSRIFWDAHKDRVKMWFDIPDDFARELEIEKAEVLTPSAKNGMITKIIAAVDKAIDKESSNEEHYQTLRKKFKTDDGINRETSLEINIEERNQHNKNRIIRNKQLNLFLSYSKKDKKLKEELDKHLTALKRSKKINVWHDKEIEGGSDWDETIREELQNADIILLLISPHFLASDYIWNTELKYSLSKHEQGTAKVIPIFLRRVYTEDMPFDKLQGYISKDKPIASFPAPERDDAFYQVVEGISKDIEKWAAK